LNPLLQRTITRSVPIPESGRRISGFKRALLCAWGTLLLVLGFFWGWDILELQLADAGVVATFVAAGAADVAVALAGRAPESRKRFLTFKLAVVLLNLVAIFVALGIAVTGVLIA
jgi:hypothetical protein